MTIANTPSTIISGNGLHQPWGLAFDASGQLWVASSGDDTVRQYLSDGTFLQSIIAGPVPAGLAVDQLGNVWVTSYIARYVQEIDPSASSVIQAISTPGGVLPTGLAFDASGDLWLSMVGGVGDIYENAGGSGFQFAFNTGGTGDNYDIAFDALGNLWISDFGNQTVQGFATDGTLIQTLGGFLGPTAIEFDSSGNLWVAEYWSNSIRSVSTIDGATIETVTGVINAPWGLAFDSQGDLWVSNYSLDQVQEYAYLRPSPIPVANSDIPAQIQIGRFTAANEWAGSGLHDFPVANSYATINFSSQVAGFIGGITRSITVHDLSTMYQTTSTVSQADGEHALPFAKISESLLQEVLDANTGPALPLCLRLHRLRHCRCRELRHQCSRSPDR